MAELPPGGEPNSEPLKCQTWVLKVSIHCEGCKKKVKKILNSVYGVYTIDVDTKEQKVTVTGDVDSNTLIRKLEKSGKHAELLLPTPPKDPNKKKDPSSQHHQKQQSDEGQAIQTNPTVNPVQPQKKGDPSDGAVENSNPPKGNDGNQNPNSGNHQQKQHQVKGVKFEASTPAAGEKVPPENAAEKGEKSGGGGGAAGSSGGKKKKKKRGDNGGDTNNGNNGNVEVSGQSSPVATNGGPVSTESPPSQQGQDSGPYPNPNPVNMSPPRHPNHNRVYEYPPAHFVPPPVYAVSYNTAHPSSSYSTSYYYPAPPPYSSVSVNHRADVAQPPPLDWNLHSSQPSDSFEMFSDENPNACSVM